MIRIDRRKAREPAALRRSRAAELPLLEARVAAGNRLTAEDFKRNVYASAPVKRALATMQNRKCAYCERECEPFASPVDHFRPKTEARRADGDYDVGYWWLAYSFDNLLLACAACNNKKASKFPLEAGGVPLSPHEDPRRNREPAILIDPTREDPAKHIAFEKVNRAVKIVGRTERGKQTIAALGLDRDHLHDVRHRFLKHHMSDIVRDFLRAKAERDKKEIERVRRRARQHCRSERTFSLLAAAYFRAAGVL